MLGKSLSSFSSSPKTYGRLLVIRIRYRLHLIISYELWGRDYWDSVVVFTPPIAGQRTVGWWYEYWDRKKKKIRQPRWGVWPTRDSWKNRLFSWWQQNLRSLPTPNFHHYQIKTWSSHSPCQQPHPQERRSNHHQHSHSTRKARGRKHLHSLQQGPQHIQPITNHYSLWENPKQTIRTAVLPRLEPTVSGTRSSGGNASSVISRTASRTSASPSKTRAVQAWTDPFHKSISITTMWTRQQGHYWTCKELLHRKGSFSHNRHTPAVLMRSLQRRNG